jgi:Ca2+-binding EF-hand superfamily protein
MDNLPRKRLTLRSAGSYLLDHADKNLTILFQEIDCNHDGSLSQEEFVKGLLAMPFVDISAVEAVRLFTTIDVDNSNTISLHEFVQVSSHSLICLTIHVLGCQTNSLDPYTGQGICSES